MGSILLLGAGFSRNWGGWLASEAFEYLLGCQDVVRSRRLRDLLWKHQPTGGFEDALAELQDCALRSGQANDSELVALQAAVSRMFTDMNDSFIELVDWEFQNQKTWKVGTFLTRFDSIFTLNQDTLLERHYLSQSVGLSDARKWTGAHLPGMRRVPGDDPMYGTCWARSTWVPMAEDKFKIDAGLQPFFKLHGSSNWFDKVSGARLLIMGGAKLNAIKQQPILSWYAREFEAALSRPNVRLMAIGYGFRDQYINDAITRAVADGLQIFVIAPEGGEIAMKLNQTRRPGNIIASTPLEETMQRSLIGASRRPLRDIFGGDIVEFGKVMRFFDA